MSRRSSREVLVDLAVSLLRSLGIAALLCIWAALVALRRGADAFRSGGFSLATLCASYAIAAVLVGLMLGLARPWSRRSGASALITGALIGAVALPAFLLPTSSIEEWRSTLPWYVPIGGVVGAFLGVKALRDVHDAENVDVG